MKGEIYRNSVKISHGSAKAWNLERRWRIKIPHFPVQLLQNLVIWCTGAKYLVVDYTHTLGRKAVLPQLDSNDESQHVIDLKAQDSLTAHFLFTALISSGFLGHLGINVEY